MIYGTKAIKSYEGGVGERMGGKKVGWMMLRWVGSVGRRGGCRIK